MFKRFLLLCAAIAYVMGLWAQNQRYNVRGEVLNRATRQPIPYASIIVEGSPTYGASADSLGRFEIFAIPPGIYRFEAYSLGYEPALSAEYIVSANTSPVEIEMDEDERAVDSVVVTRTLLSRVVQSPVSMRQIGVQLIERSAGANRDVSKVVQSFPGVAFSPAAYRNDLIVRGGSPSENRFYVDGFELPNINHFSTQGASGGPVGLINADLVRQIDLYSGAFPISTEGSLSSVLDIKLRDGDAERHKFKATIGASEVGVSSSGHFGDKTTYIFSARRSYLQLLFSALGLPFLPDYIDVQFKSRTRLSQSDELSFLVVGALDDLTLNQEAESESSQYLLSYLPTIKQKTLTLGASYRHFDGSNAYTLYLSHSILYNNNNKYRGNDASLPSNRMLDLNSIERWTTLRSENRRYLGDWTLRYGGRVGYNSYSIDSYTPSNIYDTSLRYWQYGLYVGGGYRESDDLFSASVGLRADGASLSESSSQLWRYLSPRVALSVRVADGVTLSTSSGVYHQLPPSVALSYRSQGEYVNKDLGYMRVWESTLGVGYLPSAEVKLGVELFYKKYSDLLVSIADDIPLFDKGNDYGTVGVEPIAQDGDGIAYGVELLARWSIPSKLSAVASLTLLGSEYRVASAREYRPSAWDNHFIFSGSCSYNLPRNWTVAAKVSAIGGAPYTPYDLVGSSLVEVWDVTGRAQYDYDRYNTERLAPYWQLDLRVDKNYFFQRWSMGLYLDLQNVFANKIALADIPISTGIIENPQAPPAEQRYMMKYISSERGTLLPTLGIYVEF